MGSVQTKMQGTPNQPGLQEHPVGSSPQQSLHVCKLVHQAAVTNFEAAQAFLKSAELAIEKIGNQSTPMMGNAVVEHGVYGSDQSNIPLTDQATIADLLQAGKQLIRVTRTTSDNLRLLKPFVTTQLTTTLTPNRTPQPTQPAQGHAQTEATLSQDQSLLLQSACQPSKGPVNGHMTPIDTATQPINIPNHPTQQGAGVSMPAVLNSPTATPQAAVFPSNLASPVPIKSPREKLSTSPLFLVAALAPRLRERECQQQQQQQQQIKVEGVNSSHVSMCRGGLKGNNSVENKAGEVANQSAVTHKPQTAGMSNGHGNTGRVNTGNGTRGRAQKSKRKVVDDSDEDGSDDAENNGSDSGDDGDGDDDGKKHHDSDASFHASEDEEEDEETADEDEDNDSDTDTKKQRPARRKSQKQAKTKAKPLKPAKQRPKRTTRASTQRAQAADDSDSEEAEEKVESEEANESEDASADDSDAKVATRRKTRASGAAGTRGKQSQRKAATTRAQTQIVTPRSRSRGGQEAPGRNQATTRRSSRLAGRRAPVYDNSDDEKSEEQSDGEEQGSEEERSHEPPPGKRLQSREEEDDAPVKPSIGKAKRKLDSWSEDDDDEGDVSPVPTHRKKKRSKVQWSDEDEDEAKPMPRSQKKKGNMAEWSEDEEDDVNPAPKSQRVTRQGTPDGRQKTPAAMHNNESDQGTPSAALNLNISYHVKNNRPWSTRKTPVKHCSDSATASAKQAASEVINLEDDDVPDVTPINSPTDTPHKPTTQRLTRLSSKVQQERNRAETSPSALPSAKKGRLSGQKTAAAHTTTPLPSPHKETNRKRRQEEARLELEDLQADQPEMQRRASGKLRKVDNAPVHGGKRQLARSRALQRAESAEGTHDADANYQNLEDKLDNEQAAANQDADFFNARLRERANVGEHNDYSNSDSENLEDDIGPYDPKSGDHPVEQIAEDSSESQHGSDDESQSGDSFIVEDSPEEAVDRLRVQEAMLQLGAGGAHEKEPDRFHDWIQHILYKITGLTFDNGRPAAEDPVLKRSAKHFQDMLQSHFTNAKVWTWVTSDRVTKLTQVVKDYPGLQVFEDEVLYEVDAREKAYARGYDYADFESEDEDTPRKGGRVFKRTPPLFVCEDLDDTGLHKEWTSTDEGICCFCNASRAHNLYQVVFSKSSMETDNNGELLPAAGDQAETISYAGAGGRCLYRIRLLHCLHHFERRLTAALKLKVKRKLWSEHMVEDTDVDVGDAPSKVVSALLDDQQYIDRLYQVYKHVCNAASIMHQNESFKSRKTKGGGYNGSPYKTYDAAITGVPQAWDAYMGLHPDLEAREPDLAFLHDREDTEHTDDAPPDDGGNDGEEVINLDDDGNGSEHGANRNTEGGTGTNNGAGPSGINNPVNHTAVHNNSNHQQQQRQQPATVSVHHEATFERDDDEDGAMVAARSSSRSLPRRRLVLDDDEDEGAAQVNTQAADKHQPNLHGQQQQLSTPNDTTHQHPATQHKTAAPTEHHIDLTLPEYDLDESKHHDQREGTATRPITGQETPEQLPNTVPKATQGNQQQIQESTLSPSRPAVLHAGNSAQQNHQGVVQAAGGPIIANSPTGIMSPSKGRSNLVQTRLKFEAPSPLQAAGLPPSANSQQQQKTPGSDPVPDLIAQRGFDIISLCSDDDEQGDESANLRRPG